MPYQANSKSQQRVRQRLEAVAQGIDPDVATGEVVGPVTPTLTQAAVMAEMANGATLRAASTKVVGQAMSGVYAERALASERVQLPMRAAMAKERDLSPRMIAKRLARRVRDLDSDEPWRVQIGMKAVNVVCRLRGELATQAPSASGGPPPNLQVVIAVLQELSGKPQPIVVETLHNHDVNGNPSQPGEDVE